MKVVLKTITEVTKSIGNLAIFTYFVETLSSIRAFISDSVFQLEGENIIENELYFVVNGYEDVSFFIDENGELIILSDDNKTFTVNDNGELIMEELV